MSKSQKRNKCDIIIPIYNAYDCLSECIDSVIKNTDLENNGLIIINDKSTDNRVEKLLKEYKKKYPYIKVLENKKNLGFVATVNRGMKLSKNDVLLLNSDTVVTSRWLEKIKECAYSGEMIATVTPLSNNATLASVPKIFERNELPKGMSIDEMGELVERCSYKDYPEIPTAHGFCMYIKRSVLEEVGYFDEETFGKGYGEENDFCFRCLDVGYRHLLCDDTYIYHKESQSFSGEKYELRVSAQKVLEEKFPDYENVLKRWIDLRPVRYIGNNIATEMESNKKRINILFLIHDWKNVEQNVGGTTLHAYDLIRNLRKKYNFHIFAPEDGAYKLYSYWSETESVTKFPGVTKFNNFDFYNSTYKENLLKIIKNWGISLIHIHHMQGHFFDVVDIAKEIKLPMFFTIHDFYSINPILENFGSSSSNLSVGIIYNWRKEWDDFYMSAEKVFAPSDFAKEEVLKVYRQANIKVIEHGIDFEKKIANLDITNKKVYNIAFVGVMAKHKGRDTMVHLIAKQNLKNIKFHLFGSIQEVKLKNSKNFIDHGPYKRRNLPSLLKKNDIDLACIFSTYPETYSYTFTEIIASGVPVLGVDIGAVGERIRKNKTGWLIEPDTPLSDYKNILLDILGDPFSYKKVINNIQKYKVRTTREMSEEYDEFYSNAGVVKECDLENIRDILKESDRYLQFSSQPSYPDYSWVFDTLKWKIIDKFKIPKSIKKLYRKIRGR